MPGEYTPYIGPLVPLSDEERKALVRDRLAQLDGVQNKHDVVLSDAPVDAGPLARLQLAEMHRLLAPVLEAAAFSPAHEKASDAIARLLAQWRSGLSPRVPPAQPAALATPSVTVEEVQAVIEAGRALLDRYSVNLTGYGGLALGDPPSSDCYEEWERFYNAHKRLSLPRAPAKETSAVEAEVVNVDHLVNFVDSSISNRSAMVDSAGRDPWELARSAAKNAIRDYFSPSKGAQSALARAQEVGQRGTV